MINVIKSNNLNFPTFSASSSKALLLFSMLASSPLALAADYVGHKLNAQQLAVTTDEFKVTVTARNDSAFEVHYVSLDEVSKPQVQSFALLDEPSLTGTWLKEAKNSLTFSAGDLTAVITKSPFKISYFQGEKLLLAEEKGFVEGENNSGFRFALSNDEKLIGGGQRVLGMDRRGHKLPLYNQAHYGYTTESKQMYYGLPMVMSSNKYMLIYDNSARGEMDLGETEKNIMSFSSVGGRQAYVVVAGTSYPDLIEEYVEIAGTQPMPPRWALGNFASRFGYHNEQEVYDVVAKFKQDDIPLDGIVLDLYWFGPDIQGHMGTLNWDREAFPNAEKMMSDLEQQGVNTITISEPFITTTSKRYQDAVEKNALAKTAQGEVKNFDFFFGNTGIVDVFNEDGRTWFNDIYTMLHEQGVNGWWGDLGEPEVHPADTMHVLDNGLTVSADEIHNAYGHQWAKMLFENQVSIAPDERPFIMMRSGFAGSHRYGMIPWTGDVSRSWGGLKPQVELTLQMGLMGMAYNHSDLGGFAGGETFDAEMYTRWLQYGVFQPVYRPHAQEAIAPEPVFHDDTTKSIVRDYIKLRYQLLPYNYTLAFENNQTGMPLMRPLFFGDEQNQALIAEKDTYLWGDAFLVTPVTDPGVKAQTMNVPQGVWFNFWNGDKVVGGNAYDFAVTLETIPVLVKAGSFVPMVDVVSSTKDYSSESLTLHYYHDATVKAATGQMYEDDGKTYQAYEKGEYELLSFSSAVTKSGLDFDLVKAGGSYAGMPAERNITLVVHNAKGLARKGISIQGVQLDKVASVKVLANVDAGYVFDAATNQLSVKFNWSGKKAAVAIK